MRLCIGLHNYYYYINDVTESWSHTLTFRQGHTEISNWPPSIGLVMETFFDDGNTNVLCPKDL